MKVRRKSELTFVRRLPAVGSDRRRGEAGQIVSRAEVWRSQM